MEEPNDRESSLESVAAPMMIASSRIGLPTSISFSAGSAEGEFAKFDISLR